MTEATIIKPGPGSEEKNWVVNIPSDWRLDESLIIGAYRDTFSVQRSPFIRTLPKYTMVKISADQPEDMVNKFVGCCRQLAESLQKFRKK